MIMKPVMQRLQMFELWRLAGLGGFGWEQALALVWGQKALSGIQIGWFALIYAALGSISSARCRSGRRSGDWLVGPHGRYG